MSTSNVQNHVCANKSRYMYICDVRQLLSPLLAGLNMNMIYYISFLNIVVFLFGTNRAYPWLGKYNCILGRLLANQSTGEWVAPSKTRWEQRRSGGFSPRKVLQFLPSFKLGNIISNTQTYTKWLCKIEHFFLQSVNLITIRCLSPIQKPYLKD